MIYHDRVVISPAREMYEYSSGLRSGERRHRVQAEFPILLAKFEPVHASKGGPDLASLAEWRCIGYPALDLLFQYGSWTTKLDI